jgi:hypothetical protein
MKAEPMDYGWQKIPDLKSANGTSNTTNEDKSKILAEMFFPTECPPT